MNVNIGHKIIKKRLLCFRPVVKYKNIQLPTCNAWLPSYITLLHYTAVVWV